MIVTALVSDKFHRLSFADSRFKRLLSFLYLLHLGILLVNIVDGLLLGLEVVTALRLLQSYNRLRLLFTRLNLFHLRHCASKCDNHVFLALLMLALIKHLDVALVSTVARTTSRRPRHWLTLVRRCSLFFYEVSDLFCLVSWIAILCNVVDVSTGDWRHKFDVVVAAGATARRRQTLLVVHSSFA